MSGFSDPLVGGGGALAYPSIHSPGYIPGSAGWSVKKDGSAEFNNVTIRGAAIEDAEGLWYSPSPGPNNLVASISAGGGTDTYGNAYLPGNVSYGYDGSTYTATQLLAGTTPGVMLWAAPTQVGYSWSRYAWLVLDPGSGQWVSGGDLVANNPNQNGILAETWHTMTLASGWGAGLDVNGNVYTPSYKMLPDGSLAIRGCLVTPSSGSVTGVAFATLPVQYANTFTSPPTAAVVNATGNTAGVVAVKSTAKLYLYGGFGVNYNVYLDSILQRV